MYNILVDFYYMFKMSHFGKRQDSYKESFVRRHFTSVDSVLTFQVVKVDVAADKAYKNRSIEIEIELKNGSLLYDICKYVYTVWKSVF